MLASGAHVKIGDVEYLLDESHEDHYTHDLSPRELGPSEIIGSDIDGVPGKVSLKENKILWTWDDFSGGEGNRIYYPDQPTKYSYAEGLNPRIRGQLTGRPSRTRTTVTTGDITAQPLLTAATGALWMALPNQDTGSMFNRLAWMTDGTTWTTVTYDFINNQPDLRITAMAGDPEYVYWAEWTATGNYNSISRGSLAGVQDVLDSEADSPPWIGLEVFNGYVYAWNGVRLVRANTAGAWPDTEPTEQLSPQVLNTPDGDNYQVSYWGDMITADNQLVMFYTMDGLSKVYEYHLERGFSEIWCAPTGFSIKSICYQNGMVYALGHWGADASADVQGFGAMYAIDLDSRQADFVSFFRKEIIGDLQMMEMTPSYGNTILVASAKTGRTFVYDADLEAVSMLDDLNPTRFGTSKNKTDSTSFTDDDHRIGGMATFGNLRFVAVYRPGSSGSGSHQVLTYENDEPDNRQASTSTGNYAMDWYSGEFDLGFPFEGKLLHGVYAAYNVEDSGQTSGLDDGQQIVIAISLDDATDVTLATIGPSTTPSSGVQGRTFVSDLTNNRKFYKARLKVTLKGTQTSAVDYQPPVLKAVTIEASLDDYEETWDLVVRTKDELAGERPSARALPASTLRDNLEDLVQNKNSVTLLDGARYKGNGEYTTHTVTVEKVVDSIERVAEGTTRVRLRAVSK